MKVSKNLRKILVSVAALLMFAGIGSNVNNIHVNASHARIHKVTKHHSRKALRNYKHKRNVHKYNLRKLNHRRNAHKWNARHAHKHATNKAKKNKKTLLTSASNSNTNNDYQIGHQNGLTFANDWLGTAKPNDIAMIQHLANNSNYHKGWIDADAPYAGGRSYAQTTYNALSTGSYGISQTYAQYIKK